MSGIFRGGMDFHGWGHLRAARCNRFWCFLYFDEAHSAIASYFESFVVAESGDLNIVFLGCLEDGEVVIDLVGFVVDEDLYLFGGERGIGSEIAL